jgi:hypothetical protein
MKWMKMLLIGCLVCFITTPTYCCADEDVNMEEVSRNRIAIGLTALTFAGLGIGIASLSTGSGSKNKSHSHKSNASNGYTSYLSNYCYSGSRGQSVFIPPQTMTINHNPFDEISFNNDTIFTGPSTFPFTNNPSGNIFNTLTGYFFSTPDLNDLGNGNFIPFIELPDGSINELTTIAFEDHRTSSFFGPFTQPGTYYFGIRLDEVTILPVRTLIGSVTIEINQAPAQTFEFIIPANRFGAASNIACFNLNF